LSNAVGGTFTGNTFTPTGGSTTFSVIVPNINIATTQEHFFRITPFVAATTGATSEAAGTYYPATSAASALTATPSAGQVSLAWTAPTSAIAPVTYAVQYRVTGTSSWYVANKSQSAVTAIIAGLVNGTSYDFSILASSASGAAQSISNIVTAIPFKVPEKYQLVVDNVPGDATKLQLFWSTFDTGGYPISTLIIDRSVSGGAFAVLRTLAAATPADKAIIDAGSFTDTNLTANTQYRYQIRATNSAPTPQTSVNSDIALAYAQAVYVAPSGLSAATGNATVTLTWTPPTQVGQPIQGYSILRSLDGSIWTTLEENSGAPSSGSQNTFTDQSVINGTTYYYKIAALTSLGVGEFSSVVSATPVGPSQAPSNVVAITDDSSVLLTWTAPLNTGGTPVTGYRILGCNSATLTGSGATITGCGTTYTANTNTTATSYNITGLTNGTTYYFGIQALTGSTPPQGFISMVTAVPRALTPAVSSLAVAPTDQVLTLSWTAPTAPAGSPVYGYRIDLCSSTSCTDSDFVTLTSNTQSTSNSYVVSGLTNGTLYTFRVYPVTVRFTGGNVFGSFATVTGRPGTASTAPIGLFGVPGDGRVTLNWQAPINNGGGLPFQYFLQFSTDGTNWFNAPNTSNGYIPSSSTSIVVSGLTNGTTYRFRMNAQNSAGTSENTIMVNTTIVPGSPASAPQAVSSTVTNRTVTLTWTAPSTTGVGSFIKYRVEQLFGATWAPAAGSPNASTPFSQAVTGLTNGTAYSFRIAYESTFGVGAYAFVQATPQTTSSAVQGLQALASDQTIGLYWTAPLTTGGLPINGYKVEQTSPNVVVYTTNTTLPAIGGYQITGLTNGTSYTFRVTPVTSAGDGAAVSISAMAVALPSPPGSVTTVVSNQSIGVTWTAPVVTGSGLTVSGYDLQYSADGGVTWLPSTPIRTNALTQTFANGATYTIVNGVNYQIRIRSINALGSSVWLVVDGLVPGTRPLAPSTIDVVTDSLVGGALNVSWTAPASSSLPVRSYQVDYINSFKTVTAVSVSGTTATYTAANHGFTAGQVVTVQNLTNNSLNGETLTIVSVLNANSFTVTLPVSGVPSITSQDGRAAVWQVATSNISPTANTYQIVGLAASTSYFVRVAAINSFGIGAFTYTTSAVSTSSVAAPTVGSATGLAVTDIGGTSAKLNFNLQTGATPATNRLVEISTVNGDGTYAGWSTFTGSVLPAGVNSLVAPLTPSVTVSGTTSLQLVGLLPSTQYAVRVTPRAQVSPGIYSSYVNNSATNTGLTTNAAISTVVIEGGTMNGNKVGAEYAAKAFPLNATPNNYILAHTNNFLTRMVLVEVVLSGTNIQVRRMETAPIGTLQVLLLAMVLVFMISSFLIHQVVLRLAQHLVLQLLQRYLRQRESRSLHLATAVQVHMLPLLQLVQRPPFGTN